MIKKKDRAAGEVNASSMADIAFLLLIFFIITSSIVNDTGVKMTLPILQEPVPVETDQRDVCMVIMNSDGNLLVEDEPLEVNRLKPFVKTFIMNKGQNPIWSTSPKKALIVLKQSRGANYKDYLKVTNQIQQAYFELWSGLVGVSAETLVSWDVENNEGLSRQLDKLRDQIPYNFSVAQIKK